jgi:hypothetical protein
LSRVRSSGSRISTCKRAAPADVHLSTRRNGDKKERGEKKRVKERGERKRKAESVRECK